MQRGWFYSLMLGVCLTSTAAHAFTVAPPAKEEPVLLKADDLGYDSMSEIVVAAGHVEVVQGDYILQADKITYYKNQNSVKAQGHVVLLEPNGNVVVADTVKLSNNLKDGLIQHFKATMADKSRFAAQEASRENAQKITMRQAVYSPCPVCMKKDGTEGDPLWQIRAKKIKIDEQEQFVTYRDAWMEVWGVPVAYTPFFRHPTPDADPKMGLLMPTYKHSSLLGTTLKTPVFIPIAPNKDLTLTPFLTSEEGPVLEGEYRYKTDNGDFQFNGSVTNPHDRDAQGVQVKGRNIRGHIFATGNSQLTEHWSWGFNVNRSSDDTYLRRYSYGNYDLLTSQAYADRIDDRNMLRIQGVAFQGLDVDDDPDREPYALPSIDGHFESHPMALGARTYADINTLALTRNLGTEYRRLSSTVGVKVPYVSSGGHVFESDISMRGDAYSVSDVTRTDNSNYNGAVNRAMPKASVAWNYPLVKQVHNAALVVAPTAMLVARSQGNNSDKIPNEDSLNSEFSDINLFSDNRYAGLDRVEDGTHAIYGVDTSLQMEGNRRISFLIGEDMRLAGANLFPTSSNPDDDFSDIVGRLALNTDTLDLSYRFRLDQQDMNINRSEVSGGLNLHPVTLQADYIRLADDPTEEEREEAVASGGLYINDQWSLNSFGQRDLVQNRMVAAGGGLVYTHDCITVGTEYRREFIRDRDIEPNSTFSLKLSLKNLN